MRQKLGLIPSSQGLDQAHGQRRPAGEAEQDRHHPLRLEREMDADREDQAQQSAGGHGPGGCRVALQNGVPPLSRGGLPAPGRGRDLQ